MLKHLFITLFIITPFISKAQTLTISDLIKLTNDSFSEANQYLTNEQKYKCTSTKTIYGQTISQFIRNDEFIIKNQWKDENRTIPGLHYSFKSKAVEDSLIREIKDLSFKLKEDYKDNNKHVLLYENDQYTISIYTFIYKKSSVELEIHGK